MECSKYVPHTSHIAFRITKFVLRKCTEVITVSSREALNKNCAKCK